MTNQEQTLLFFDDYFKQHKVDYMIFASSLLHIVREGKLIPEDAEIDIIVQGNDLNKHLIENIFKAAGYWMSTYSCKEEYGEMYLTNQSSIQPEYGWIALNPLWFKKGVCYQNMLDDKCILWDSKFYEKKTWSTIKYLNRNFKVPNNPEEWLEKWYGSDWNIPLPGNWRDNKNCKSWDELWH